MNYDLWFCLACYFVIGVILVLVGRVLVKLFYKDKRSDFVKGVLVALEEDKTPQQKRREFFKSIATGSLVFVVWPVAFAVLVNELRGQPNSTTANHDEPKFKCAEKDLVEIVNPHEVETVAKVVDPKKRVSELPFGHLNKGWKALRRQMRIGDVMWSFQTAGYQPRPAGGHKGPQYAGPRDVISGYALVRNRKVVGEFLTHWN